MTKTEQKEPTPETKALELLTQKEMAALNGETAAITLGLRETRLIIVALEAGSAPAAMSTLKAKIDADASRFVEKGHKWQECAETDHEGVFTEGYLRACKNIIADIDMAVQRIK